MKIVLKRFIPSPETIFTNSSTRFIDLLRPLFPTSGWFFVLPLWKILRPTLFYSVYNGSNIFPSILNTFFMFWIKHFVYWGLFTVVFIYKSSCCVSPFSYFDIFWITLLLLPMFDTVFGKSFPEQNFPQFYSQIKHKKGNS